MTTIELDPEIHEWLTRVARDHFGGIPIEAALKRLVAEHLERFEAARGRHAE